jgi:hypothetical protein
MPWDDSRSEAELFAASDALDRQRVAELVEELIEHLQSAAEPYPLKGAKRILQELRGRRAFVLLQRLADAFIQSGRDDPVIHRQYAQALLDQGNVTAGMAVLHAVVADADVAPADDAEARGLLGRGYKQMYIAAASGPPERRRRFLERAIAEYRGVYDESRLGWHGINAVALLERAARDGIALEGVEDPDAEARALAQEILDAIEALGDDADMWDKGTAMEACVALDRGDDALEWLADYLRAGVDAFALATTLRQLTEVWGLDPDADPGARLLPVLQAELLAREGGPDVTIGDTDLAPGGAAAIAKDPGFEKVLGKDRFQTVRWFATALERCRAIARIEDPIDGGIGTGFLVAGAALGPGLPEVVLLTNAHVISKDHPGALAPERARVTFRALEGEPRQYRVVRLWWSSAPSDLDVSIVELDARPQDALCCPLADGRPLANPESPPRTYIIGHPSAGDEVMLSMHDNHVLDQDDIRLHYRTPTLGGSSGSPVFNRSWELIAVHHAGKTRMQKLHGQAGTYPANEGIWIDKVVAALATAQLTA